MITDPCFTMQGFKFLTPDWWRESWWSEPSQSELENYVRGESPNKICNKGFFVFGHLVAPLAFLLRRSRLSRARVSLERFLLTEQYTVFQMNNSCFFNCNVSELSAPESLVFIARHKRVAKQWAKSTMDNWWLFARINRTLLKVSTSIWIKEVFDVRECSLCLNLAITGVILVFTCSYDFRASTGGSPRFVSGVNTSQKNSVLW